MPGLFISSALQEPDVNSSGAEICLLSAVIGDGLVL